MPRKKANRTKTEMEERYGIDFEYDYRIEAVEMYLADPNPNVTMIAEKMGVSRNTIGNFVNRPEIKEALYLERERRHKLALEEKRLKQLNYSERLDELILLAIGNAEDVLRDPNLNSIQKWTVARDLLYGRGLLSRSVVQETHTTHEHTLSPEAKEVIDAIHANAAERNVTPEDPGTQELRELP